MPIGQSHVCAGARLAFAFFVFVSAPATEAQTYHRRFQRFHGPSPVFYGWERPAPTIWGPFGWRYRRFRRSDALTAQLDPRLRGNDGNLGVTLANPPYSSPEPRYDVYGYPVVEGAPSLVYLEGQRRRRWFFRRRY